MSKLQNFALAFLLVLVCTCGAAGEIVLRYAHNNNNESAIGQSALKFKELVEAKSNGEIVVEIYPDAQLGDEDELMESIRSNIVDFASFGAPSVVKVLPDFQLFVLPYLFTSVEQMHQVTDGEVGKMIVQKGLDTAGIKIFETYWTDGERYYFNNKRAIYTPADMKGLALRVPDQEAYILPCEMLGAQAVAMPFSESYLAVSSGMVDGLEGIAAQAVVSNFNEICKYLCLDGHIISPSVLVMSPRKFNSLSAAHQEIIEAAAHETGVFQRTAAAKLSSDALEVLRERGMTITEVDKKLFMEAVQSSFDRLAASIDPKILELAVKARDGQ